MSTNFIWQAFLAGEKAALSEVFLTYYDDLFRYGFKLTRDRSIVEDAIQDLFFRLWKNRLNLKPVDNPKPYLFKSLRNHIRDCIQKVKPCLELNDITEDCLNIEYSHEDFLINDQINESTMKKVVSALNKLPSKQREIIYLRYFEDIDFDTIARIMEIKVQSVRNSIHRGMIALRDLMLLQPFLIMLG